MEFDTKAIHGEETCPYEGAISFPIFQTSTFEGGNGFSYSRCGNPTRSALEAQLAKLENAKHAFAFSSGLGAVNAVFSLLKQGDRVLVSDDLYGGTHRLISEIFSNFGIDFVFCDMCCVPLLEQELKKGAAMVLTETPTNPTMKISDIPAISALCKKSGALLAVDNTFLTPYFQNPLSLGADIVIHSATKYLSGHHDTLSGFCAVNDDLLAKKLSLIAMTLGNSLAPFDCWLVMRGIKTLSLRMERHQKNAFAAARFLETLDKVERVVFPGLTSHPDHLLCKRQSRGFGGVVAFWTRDSKTAQKLMRGGSLIRFAESLGGTCSLITHPLTQTHASVPAEKRDLLGINGRLFRLSVGLEAESDIISDLCDMIC